MHSTISQPVLMDEPVNGDLFLPVPAEALAQAVSAFQPIGSFKRPVYSSPKCPVPKSAGVRNVLVTAALPYVNNVPHLGNLIGSTLSANVFALYCELAGHNVMSICGTDEYGTTTETKAMAEQMSPREICDKYHSLHSAIYNWFDIRFDYFGRTSTEQHTKIVQSLFLEVWKNQYIDENTVEQLFCENCTKFLADRLVCGNCPYCDYPDAAGDQCDKCGKLINAVELKQPKCKICQRTPVLRSSKHLFLALPKLEDKLSAFLEHRMNDPSSQWTTNARTISSSWIRDGLKPRCITRDLKWGVPVPLDAYKDKVFYVWFDAPLGYISLTASYTPHWRRWWQPSSSPEYETDAPIELFQFMAKDNVPFHSIIFPACLLAANQGHTMVTHLLSTDYMNYEGTKFSKSRGYGVFGDTAMDSGIPSNVWRFYLVYRRPETQDSSFMWNDFVLVNNSELLNNLGNFINRALSFVVRFFKGVIPEMVDLGPEEAVFLAQVNQLIFRYVEHLESGRLREGLREILCICRLGNGFLQATQPWVMIKQKETKTKAGTLIGVAANVACLLGLLLFPYMPTISHQVWFEQCNASADTLSLLPITRQHCCLPQLLPAGHRIGKVSPLFRKIDTEGAARLVSLFSGPNTMNGVTPSEG